MSYVRSDITFWRLFQTNKKLFFWGFFSSPHNGLARHLLSTSEGIPSQVKKKIHVLPETRTGRARVDFPPEVLLSSACGLPGAFMPVPRCCGDSGGKKGSLELRESRKSCLARLRLSVGQQRPEPRCLRFMCIRWAHACMVCLSSCWEPQSIKCRRGQTSLKSRRMHSYWMSLSPPSSSFGWRELKQSLERLAVVVWVEGFSLSSSCGSLFYS